MSWITQIEADCGSFQNVTQLRNYILFKKVQKLLVECPGILDDEVSGDGKTLTWAIAQIECGLLFEEFALLQYEAKLAQYDLQCAEQRAANGVVIASGIYTSDAEASATIELIGVLPTDTVFAIIQSQDGDETVLEAVAGTDEITITFSAATDNAEVGYVVIRNQE